MSTSMVVQSEYERQVSVARFARERLMGAEPIRPKAKPQPPRIKEEIAPVVIVKPPEPEFEPLMLPGDHTKEIILDVCRKHRLSVGEILSHRRMQRIVHARQEAFYRLAKETSLSLPQMAKRMGGFDHTTALHAIRKHEQRMLDEKLAVLDAEIQASNSGDNSLAKAKD